MTQYKKITLTGITLFGINSIIGAGVFLTPGRAYAMLGTNLFWILPLCGFLALLIGLVFAEMGSRYTRTGGLYVYVYETLGPFLGFNIGLVRILASCVALAVQMVAVPNILHALLPQLFSLTPLNCAMIGIGFCLFLTIINLITVKATIFSINITSWLLLFILAVCIISTLTHVHWSNFHESLAFLSVHHLNTPHFMELNEQQFSNGFLLLFYIYVGFENIGVAAQDIENPRRNLPRAIIAALLISTLLYILLFVGVVGVMGPKLALSNSSVADAIDLVIGRGGQWLVSIGALVIITGIGLTMSFSGARNIVPLSVDHFIDERIGQNNRRDIPVVAILLMFVTTSLLVMVANWMTQETFTLLAGVTAACRLLEYFMVSIGLLVARKQREASYKVPCYKLVIAVIVIVCLYLAIKINLETRWLTLTLILLSLTLYFGYAKQRYQKYRIT